MKFDAALKADYEKLWRSCVVKPIGKMYAEKIVKQIKANQARYEKLSMITGVPWWFIAVIHNMECGLSFEKHLHNGDLLTGLTKRVPANRPVIMVKNEKGEPVRKTSNFTFEESALDALRMMGLDKNKDWSVPYVLYRLEGFNGYGYREHHPDVKSPYLWSMTNHYTKGKYVADGKFNGEAVSQQLGIACILKLLLPF